MRHRIFAGACRWDEDYAEGLKSNFADMGNVAGSGRVVPSRRSKFLQRFVGEFPWAHLDIAGSAWKGGAAKGATGRPVGLLVHYLLGRAQQLSAKDAVKKPAPSVPTRRNVRTKPT